LLQNQLAQGKNGGAWNGNGISSTTITVGTTLALADNADLGWTGYAGQVVNWNSLIVVQARFGDASLDGKVDSFDLNLLAAHWQMQGGAMWSAGDFTGDGKVDAMDLNVLAGNWQAGGSLEGAMAAFPALAGISVPEPGTMGVLAAGAALAVQRRRRR